MEYGCIVCDRQLGGYWAHLSSAGGRGGFSTSQAQTAADCDFDGSGEVDFLAFARAYNWTSAKHDLDHSGQVDFLDFLVFARFQQHNISTGG